MRLPTSPSLVPGVLALAAALGASAHAQEGVAADVSDVLSGTPEACPYVVPGTVSAADLALGYALPSRDGARRPAAWRGDVGSSGPVPDAPGLSLRLGFSLVDRQSPDAAHDVYDLVRDGDFSNSQSAPGAQCLFFGNVIYLRSDVGASVLVQSGVVVTGNSVGGPDAAVAALAALGVRGRFLRAQVDVLEAVHSPQHRPGTTPVDILAAQYAGRAESDKIDLARAAARYMGAIGYDHQDDGKGDVPSDVMWDAYRRDAAAGVCRHIHSEVARLLSRLGMSAGVMSVRGDQPHEVLWGRKADGNFFIVDYGQYYESADPRELAAAYARVNHGVHFQTYVADADGTVLGTLRTDLQRWAVSAAGTRDARDLSAGAARRGLGVPSGATLDASAGDDGETSVRAGYGTGKNGVGLSAGTARLDGADAVACGLDAAAVTGTDALLFRWGGKLGAIAMDYGDFRESMVTARLDAQAAAAPYDDGAVRVGLGAAAGLTVGFDCSSERSMTDVVDENLVPDAAAAADFSVRPTENSEIGLSGTVGCDVVRRSNRSDHGYAARAKAAADLRAGFRGDGWALNAFGGPRASMDGAGFAAGASATAGPVTLAAEWLKEGNDENPLLAPETVRKAGLAVRVTDATALAAGVEDRVDGLLRERRASLSVETRF